MPKRYKCLQIWCVSSYLFDVLCVTYASGYPIHVLYLWLSHRWQVRDHEANWRLWHLTSFTLYYMPHVLLLASHCMTCSNCITCFMLYDMFHHVRHASCCITCFMLYIMYHVILNVSCSMTCFMLYLMFHVPWHVSCCIRYMVVTSEIIYVHMSRACSVWAGDTCIQIALQPSLAHTHRQKLGFPMPMRSRLRGTVQELDDVQKEQYYHTTSPWNDKHIFR